MEENNKMRVTTKRELGGGLKGLAYFLNCDLDLVHEEDLAEDFGLQLFLAPDLKHPGGKRAVKHLQDEVKQCVWPLVAPERQFSPEEAYNLLWELVQKANKALHRPQWGILPVDYEFYLDETGETVTGSRRLEGDELEAQSDFLHHSQRAVTLLGYRWRVGLDHGGVGSLRGYLYGRILQSLEDGEFTRLKVCKECQKFFVQADARQGFCSDPCRIESNNKRRLQSGYFSDLRQKKRERQIRKARQLLKEGQTPPEVAKETGLSLRALKRAGLVN